MESCYVKLPRAFWETIGLTSDLATLQGAVRDLDQLTSGDDMGIMIHAIVRFSKR